MEANSEKCLLADDVLCIVWCICGTRMTLHIGTAAASSAHVALKREFMSGVKIFWCMPRSQSAQWLILVLFFPFDWNPSGGEGNQ